MNLLTSETAIITRIGTAVTALKVQAFPANVSDYELLAATGAVLVRYDGSTFEEPKATAIKKAANVQLRRARWVLNIIYHSLSINGHKDAAGTTGIYTYIEAVRGVLCGYTLPALTDSSPLYLLSESFVTQEAANWVYEMVFEHQLEEYVAFV